MSRVVIGVGCVFVAMAIVVLIAPDLLVSSAWGDRSGQYLAGALRVGFGIVFVLAARSTRYPNGLRILGALFVAAGLGVLVTPNEIWADLIRYALVENLYWYRYAGGLVGLLLGGFLILASKSQDAAV